MSKAIKLEDSLEAQTLQSLQLLGTALFLLAVLMLDNVCYI
ncbi:MAG TPA: hypothetical protein VNV43_05820 [Candidatus Acidoferrales bacterium]|jgi:hypothetical protein|nr:hypothetical protein [Candidatus Acidoferrales bacterium]